VQKAAGNIRFSVLAPGCDRVHHIGADDVRIVLSRLPIEAKDRLRAVHFNDRSRGGRILGYVNRGRREIALCALPPRISFTRALVRGQSPQQFGATRGRQWPPLAIRRFMLYDVLLHELGHLQIIDEKATSIRRKFAHETRAEQFATHWCKSLWSEPFEHADPVHNPPSKAELSDPDPELTEMLRLIGIRPDDADLHQKLGKAYSDRRLRENARIAFEKSLVLDPDNPWTNLYLGNWHYKGENNLEAIRFFLHAAEIVPDRAIAWKCLGDAYWRDGDRTTGLAHYRKAVEVEPKDKSVRRILRSAILFKSADSS